MFNRRSDHNSGLMGNSTCLGNPILLIDYVVCIIFNVKPCICMFDQHSDPLPTSLSRIGGAA